MKRKVLLLVLVVLGLFTEGTGVASAEESDNDVTTLRWVTEEKFEFDTVIFPDGEVLSGPELHEGGEEEEEFNPPVGTRFLFTEDVFSTKDGKTKGELIGRDFGTCIVHVREQIVCEIAFEIFDKGQLFAATTFDFGAFEEDEAFQIEAAITGGTDDFFGAGGEIEVKEDENFDENGLSFLTVRLVTP